MSRSKRLFGLASAGAAVVVAGSAAWACAPLTDAPSEFLAVPTGNPVGDAVKNSVSGNQPIKVAGYLSSSLSDPVNFGNTNLYLDTAQLSYWPSGAPRSTCTTSDTDIGDVTISSVASAYRNVVEGQGNYNASTTPRSPGVYVVCAGAQLTFWWDTITVV